MDFSVINAEQKKYANYYSVYKNSNIFVHFDWNDILERINDKNCFFILDKEKIIGGFTFTNNEISHIFIVPPFIERILLWEQILKYASDKRAENKIILKDISEEDKTILIDIFNAKFICTERRMFRPTEKISVNPPDNFYFAIPDDHDKQEIIQTIYEAHSACFNLTGSESDRYEKDEVQEAINRRYNLFNQTNTLHISTLAKNNKNNEIAGVCIAGIYPDSTNDCSNLPKWSTIHQVSVRPQYRRQGIAESMLLHSINKAHSVSAFVSLGVTVGNPAELLYNKIGFLGGPKSSELHYIL